MAIARLDVEAGGLRVAALAAGDADAPLALCLHGFPDSAWSWAPLLESLAAGGWRAVAPFMRGYAPTAVPADGVYQTAALARDAVALHAALGGDGRAVVIGHDWGAPAAYGAAIDAPDRWRAVVGMAVPPGRALGAAFLGDLAQIKRSWYMFFFQHGLADAVVPAGDLAFVDMLWRDWSPGFDGAAHAARAKDALRGDGRLAAALGYYRATLGDGPRDPALADLQGRMGGQWPTQPLLYLHGRDDGCVGADVALAARTDAPPGARIEIVDGAGHFLQVERPDEVAGRVLAFLGGLA
ncbi:MAG: alpha/beta fold hydrolase [Ilumatobacteraceae bacterium]